MTNLRVFETPASDWLIEISASDCQLSRALFVPVVPKNLLSTFPNPDELVTIRFRDDILLVAYLVVLNRSKSQMEEFRLLGTLEETESIKPSTIC